MDLTLSRFVAALRNAEVRVSPAETLDGLDVLRKMPHPDKPGELMPIAPVLVPQTTLFEQASQGQTAEWRTVFDLDADHPGAHAYSEFARVIDG